MLSTCPRFRTGCFTLSFSLLAAGGLPAGTDRRCGCVWLTGPLRQAALLCPWGTAEGSHSGSSASVIRQLVGASWRGGGRAWWAVGVLPSPRSFLPDVHLFPGAWDLTLLEPVDHGRASELCAWKWRCPCVCPVGASPSTHSSGMTTNVTEISYI